MAGIRALRKDLRKQIYLIIWGWFIKYAKFLENFTYILNGWSHAEDNTFGSPTTRGIANLPLFGTLLAIHQKSPELSFWEVIESLVLLALAIFRLTCFRQLPASLN